MVKAINTKCSDCQYSPEYFGLLQFFCDTSEINSDTVSFQGRLVSTTDVSSAAIIDLLQEWVDSSPMIVVGGSRLTVIAQCSVGINQLGMSSCITGTNSNESQEDMPCTSADNNGNMDSNTDSLYFALAALILSIAAFIATSIGLLLLVICYCSKQTKNRYVCLMCLPCSCI